MTDHKYTEAGCCRSAALLNVADMADTIGYMMRLIHRQSHFESTWLALPYIQEQFVELAGAAHDYLGRAKRLEAGE